MNVKVTVNNGHYYIGTLVEQTESRIEIRDAEWHNPADPSVVPHKDTVRFAMRAVASVEAVGYKIPVNPAAVDEIVWQADVCTIKYQGTSPETARYVLYVDARIGTYKTLPGAIRRAEVEIARYAE